ncbi:MAG: NADH-quinone oxidoreductase subunit N [Chloroflexota bacterium]
MNLNLLSPEVALTALALVVLVLDLFIANKRILGYVSLGGLVVPAALAVGLIGTQATSFSGALIVDPFAVFFKLLFLAAAAIVILSSMRYVDNLIVWRGEFFGLILLATLGMMLMAAAGDLITIYIALETASIALYVLAGFRKSDPASGEASLKYMLLGALASAVLLYGMAFLYGLTGSTNLAVIGQKIVTQSDSVIALLAMALVISGMGFKIAAVPFQMWAPDVYQGAPTPVTAFLSVASKASGFAVLMRLATSALGPLQADWQAMFAALAVITMTVGNLAAIPQHNIKRMMGYSSIAMAGYLLVGMAALTGGGASSILFFLLAYTVTNLGAFAAIIAFSNVVGSDEIDDYAGLAGRSPMLALGFAFCLFSLIGIPPLAGFFGKFYVFAEAFNRGLAWLVVIGLLNSAVSMYYYLRVVKMMYLGKASVSTPVKVPASLALAVGVLAIGVVAIGVGVGPLMDTASVAAKALVP